VSQHITAQTQRHEHASAPATTALSIGWWAQLVASSTVTRCFIDIVSTGSNSDNVQVFVSGTEGLAVVRDNGTWGPGTVATLSHDVWYRFWLALGTGSTRAKLWWGAAGSALSSAEDTTTIGGVVTPKIVVGANLAFSRFVNGYMSAVRVFDAEIRDEPTIEAVLGTLALPPNTQNLWAAWPLSNTSNGLKDFWTSSRALTLPGAGSPANGPNPNGIRWGRATKRFVPVAAAAGGSVSGTVAVTATAPTVAATGTPVVTGTAAVTSTATVAVVGTPVVTGSAAVTTDATAAASGTPVVTGSVAVSPAASVSAVGTPVVTGTVGVTTSATVLALGADVSGTVSVTTSATVQAAGSPIISGTIALAVAAPTVAAVGTPTITGVAAVVTDATADAVGTPVVTGTVVLVPLAALSSSGTPVVSGTITATTDLPTVLALDEQPEVIYASLAVATNDGRYTAVATDDGRYTAEPVHDGRYTTVVGN
jgi:hypothetical protein